MSNRSLIEINHDYAGDLDASFMVALGRYLRSADRQNAEALERWGVKVIGMRHHSERFVVNANTDGFPPMYLSPRVAGPADEAEQSQVRCVTSSPPLAGEPTSQNTRKDGAIGNAEGGGS